MKKVVFLLFTFVMMFCLAGCNNSGNKQIDYSMDMSPRLLTVSTDNSDAEIVKAVQPAIVGILAINNTTESVGSGVCVAAEGYILTNYHVIAGSTKITVHFANKDYANASKIWGDQALDLAIIKSEKSIPYLQMSNSKDVEQGEEVLAIGTPLSLQFRHSVTKGIVSAKNRVLELEENGTLSYLQNLIQHDASINPGNSGGPLLNAKGQVIGINTVKASEAEGIGFAIPIEVCAPILDKLKKGKSLTTPFIGVFGLDATLAEFYNKTLTENGVYISDVSKNSPAYNSGLKIDDVIVKINNTPINTMLDFRIALLSYSPGESITVEYMRNGNKTDTTIILGEK